MGVKSTHQTETNDYELVTLSELPLTKKTDTYNLGSAQTPKEIIYIIISMLDSLSCLQLSMTSHLFPKFFTYCLVACLSGTTKLNPQLARLYFKYCCQSLRSTFLPQFLVLKNSDQLVKYKKTMHDGYLIIDFSKKLKQLDSSDLLGISILLISWPNNYKSCEDAIERSLDQFQDFFQFENFPDVKKLVLNNLVYSSEFMKLLIGTFDELEYLNIASYNTKSKFDVHLPDFTTINELEIMLPTSDNFTGIISFTLPTQLKKITINGLQQNSKTISCIPKARLFRTLECTLLETIIFKNELRDDIHTVFIDIPQCVKIFISNTKGWRSILCHLPIDYSRWIVIHVSESSRFEFLIESPDGELSLNEEMCPNCKEFGVFDKDGNLQIIWRKQ